jgi:predicted nucleotidyltransferase
MTQTGNVCVTRSPDEPISRVTIEQRYRPILQALEKAFAERFKTVVLFGSQARGEAL